MSMPQDGAPGVTNSDDAAAKLLEEQYWYVLQCYTFPGVQSLLQHCSVHLKFLLLLQANSRKSLP